MSALQILRLLNHWGALVDRGASSQGVWSKALSTNIAVHCG